MIDIDYKPFLKYLYLEVEIEKYKKYQHEIKKDSYKSKKKNYNHAFLYPMYTDSASNCIVGVQWCMKKKSEVFDERKIDFP